MLVRDLVEKHRAEFTTAERRLIPFLKDDSLVIELQSITKLAEAAEVSTPTVIRLARKLGFDGFPALQGAIRAELAERIKQPLAKLEAPMVESGADHLINRFAEKVVQNLGQTIGQLNLADFVAAATLLSSFDRPVYLIGGRITQPVHRVQNLDWVASTRRPQCRYDDRLAARRPKVASTAGVSVVDVSTATATARIAPVAIDCSTGVLIRYSPVTDAMTVNPDNTTARPEVAIAASAASWGSRPARNSSRKRIRMNSE